MVHEREVGLPWWRLPAVLIMVRALGLGIVLGALAGGVYGWMIALGHVFGFVIGAGFGAVYGFVSGLFTGIGVAWVEERNRDTEWADLGALRRGAMVPNLILVGAAIGALVALADDGSEGVMLLLVIPGIIGTLIAMSMAPIIAGVSKHERQGGTEFSRAPGPLAGPWD